MAKAVTLKNKNNEEVYPVTDASLVANITQIILNKTYPVGSIYMSATLSTPTQVASAIGGTWMAWGAGRVPVGVDASQTEFDTVEETGGEKTHTLTIDEMPKHSHYYKWLGGGGTESGIDESNGNKKWWGNNLYSSDTGGNQAHNNLQPYITCYMYKRTA